MLRQDSPYLLHIAILKKFTDLTFFYFEKVFFFFFFLTSLRRFARASSARSSFLKTLCKKNCYKMRDGLFSKDVDHG